MPHRNEHRVILQARTDPRRVDDHVDAEPA
jgi:hypothetical protein